MSDGTTMIAFSDGNKDYSSIGTASQFCAALAGVTDGFKVNHKPELDCENTVSPMQ